MNIGDTVIVNGIHSSIVMDLRDNPYGSEHWKVVYWKEAKRIVLNVFECEITTLDEVDFDTWWDNSKEGQQLSHIDCAEEAARAGWDAAKGN